MAKPTKDDNIRRRAVKAARKLDKERSNKTPPHHDDKQDFAQAAARSEKDGREQE